MKAKEILKDLVRFDTYKDNQNKEIMDYIQELLKEKGFKIEYRSKCLVMSIKNDCRIGFIGHTDTVKGGSDWNNNPLELTEIGGKLYGLGACDMKGGIAAILKSVLDIDWNKMSYGIKMFFSYDEEIGFKGIKEINSLNIEMPEAVIVGEPTNNELMNGSKGLLEFKLMFLGKSVHSSNPEKGENAIENSLKCLNELKTFYYNLKTETDTRFKIPYTTMNVGRIDGGKSINIVPDNCEVYIDFRLISNQQREKIILEFNRLKEKYKFEYIILNDILPFITESKNCKTTDFITEASFIQSKNRYILGAGPITAHEVDEYMTEESLNKLVEQYKEIIYKFCI